MKYTYKYRKLGKDEYTTIRRHKKANEGDIITETYPGGSHKVKVIKEWRSTLANLSFAFLYLDTDCITRQAAYKMIQSFYKKPIDFEKEKFYIYKLRRL